MASPSLISATSRQFDILNALTQQLQAITPANGYAWDLSQSVFRGRAIFGDDDPLPMISILEAPRPGIKSDAQDDKTVRYTSWELLIQGWVQDDKLNPLDPVYPLKAAVERQLSRVVEKSQTGAASSQYPAEWMLGRNSEGNLRISSMTIGPGVCRPPDGKISMRAFFYLPVTVQYKEDLSAPFV